MTGSKKSGGSQDLRARNLERISRLDRVLKALSHPVRRHILLTLKFRGEKVSSGEIASRYACTWPTVARHLSVLKAANLVVFERKGRNLIYELNKDVMKEVLEDWLSYFD